MVYSLLGSQQISDAKHANSSSPLVFPDDPGKCPCRRTAGIPTMLNDILNTLKLVLMVISLK